MDYSALFKKKKKKQSKTGFSLAEACKRGSN
jgi:hypothetical protein